MTDTPFDMDLLSQNPTLLARVVAPNQLFSLLRRSVRIPAGWTALVVTIEGDRHCASPGSEISSTQTAEVMFVRLGPQTLAMEDLEVISRDDYRCRSSVQGIFDPPVDPTDMTAFRKTLMPSADEATVSTVREHLGPAIRRGLAEGARQASAADLVDGRAAESIDAAIHKAIDPLCFSAGIRIIGNFNTHFRSDALDRLRKETERGAIEREQLSIRSRLQEAATAAKRNQLEQIERMVRQLEQMAKTTPGTPIGELIRGLGEEYRGPLYRRLLLGERPHRPCEAVVVVVGDELLWLSPSSPSQPRLRRKVQESCGPLRSVRFADGPEPLLVVGGASELILLAPADGEVRTTLTCDVPTHRAIRGGFNSAVMLDQRVFATHSELGLRMWSLNRPADAVPLLSDLTGAAKTVRNVQVDSQRRIWLSIDSVVVRLEGRTDLSATPIIYRGSNSSVTALTVAADEVYAANESGQVLSWETSRPDVCRRIYDGGAGPCRSLSYLQVAGIRRLGLTDNSPAVKEMILGDTVIEQYTAAGERLRQAWWSGDLIVGLNDRRGRLFFWRTGEPDAPFGTVDLGWLCSNRVQDVCLLPAAHDDREVGTDSVRT